MYILLYIDIFYRGDLMVINIEENKNEFITLIESIGREFNKSALINKLNSTDFFIAPASAKYHLNVEGGLCQHSLNVYYNLKKLVEMKGLSEIISEDSIKIVALLHDISKINTYKKGFKNMKVYSESGNREDGLGKYSWVSVEQYEYVDDDSRFHLLEKFNVVCGKGGDAVSRLGLPYELYNNTRTICYKFHHESIKEIIR